MLPLIPIARECPCTWNCKCLVCISLGHDDNSQVVSVWETAGFSALSQESRTKNDVPWRSATFSHRSRTGNLFNLKAPRLYLETYMATLTTGQRSFACKPFFFFSTLGIDINIHVRRSVASSVLQICYGHSATHLDDPLLKFVQAALEAPRNSPYLVDFFPLRQCLLLQTRLCLNYITVKYYPSWLPGGGFKKDAAEAQLLYQRLRYTPFDMVRSQMVRFSASGRYRESPYSCPHIKAAGTASPSFISTLLSQLPPNEDSEHSHQAGLIRDAAAVMYMAAVDSVGLLARDYLYANSSMKDRVLHVHLLRYHGPAPGHTAPSSM